MRSATSMSDRGRSRGSAARRAAFLALVVLTTVLVGATAGSAAAAVAGVRGRAPGPTACSAGHVEGDGAFRRIDSLLVATRAVERIPGMAVGVVCSDSLAFARGYGAVAVNDPTPVTPDTRFRIASITKLFTATAILKLAESGALGLDDALTRHLPWFEIGRPPGTGAEPIAIRHVLTHTAGLPRDSRLTDFQRCYQPTREAAIAALPAQRLEAAPGERYAYSNLGYGLLGEVIAAAAGFTYERYLEQEILRPLGMTTTLVHPRPDDPVTRGHGPLPERGPRGLARFWELGFATPAGGMASSLSELASFVQLHLSPYTDTEPTLVSAGRLHEMHRVQFMIDPARGGSGFGWGVEISTGQHVIYHGGELPEQTSFLLLDLQADIGVIVLTNAQDVDTERLAWQVLQEVRDAQVRRS